MVDGADLKPWALAMMLEWHYSDPVSQKEIDRCNAIYNIQNNRNPFIDHPEYVSKIWDPGAGLDEIQLNQFLNIYQTNNSKILHINQLKGWNESYQLIAYDITGKKMLQTDMSSAHIEINIGNFPKGTYILSIQNTSNQKMYQYKFVK